MTDQVLNVFKIALLALIYLFFARVLWAVWSEVRTPVATTGRIVGSRTREKKRKGSSVFVIVEPRQHRGASFTLSNSLTLGRVADNDIALDDDTFMSSHHARIEIRPEGVWVVDLESTNGTFVNGQRVTGDRSLRKGDRLQVGSTVLEMRS
jgi:hypothetical protein